MLCIQRNYNLLPNYIKRKHQNYKKNPRLKILISLKGYIPSSENLLHCKTNDPFESQKYNIA